MHNNIIFTQESKNNLNSIYSFIFKDSENNAKKVVSDLILSINNLLFFPELWKKIWLNKRILINSKHKFKIIYSINENKIIIYSIYKNKKYY